jgi:hypothetical protein
MSSLACSAKIIHPNDQEYQLEGLAAGRSVIYHINIPAAFCSKLPLLPLFAQNLPSSVDVNQVLERGILGQFVYAV